MSGLEGRDAGTQLCSEALDMLFSLRGMSADCFLTREISEGLSDAVALAPETWAQVSLSYFHIRAPL